MLEAATVIIGPGIRAGPRHVGDLCRILIWRPGQAKNLAPLKKYSLNFFDLEGAGENLGGGAQITNNFGGKFFRVLKT